MHFYRLGKNNQNRRAMKELIAQSKRLLPLEKASLAAITEKKLTRQDLLEVSDNISLYYAPKITETSKKLTLLSIDPQHLYSYWNLIENQPGTLSQSLLKKELVLKVFIETKEGTKVKTKPVTEIKISDLQASKTITLPTVESAVIYTATIGRIAPDKDFVALIKSNHASPFQDNNSLGNFVSIKPMNDVNQPYNEVSKDSFEPISPKKSHFATANFSGQNKVQVG